MDFRNVLDHYTLPFYNDSGETIPPFAVMQVSGWKDDANDRDYFTVVKPNGSGKQFLLNGPQSIAYQGDGLATRVPGMFASYGSGTPALDQEWGPKSGQWTLDSSGKGYFVVGDLDAIGGVSVVRVREAASYGNVIRAQVNAPSGVSGSDATFSFDNAIPVVGSAPSSGTGTAHNIYQQTYSDNDVVYLFGRKDTGDWETERGGSAGSLIQYFELTEDKSYADTSKLAKPVDETGALVTAADAFNVVDDKNLFYGKAATGGTDGYRGFGWKFTDDYNSTGVPGYRIIDMQGPAQWLIGQLNGSYSMGGTTVTVIDEQIRGRPSRGERLPASGDITVDDDLDVASNAQDGDKWLLAWDEKDEHYIFVLPLVLRSNLQWGESQGTITAATGWASANRGVGSVQFKKNSDGTDDGSPIDVANPYFDEFVSGSAVCCDRSVIPPLIVSVGCTTAS